MKTCEHVRQIPEPCAGGDCLMDIQLGDIYPCATPGCDAGIEGVNMVMGLRHQEYVREATPDGWAWRKKMP